jgi:hypothetical protein
MNIDKTQTIRIKILQKELGLDDDEYRRLLEQHAGVRSSTLLSRVQAAEFIAMLQRGGRVTPSVAGVAGGWPYNDLDGRPGMASGKQVRMMMAMWSEVSDAPAKVREERFGHFLRNRFQLAGYRWVQDKDVSRIVRALKAMKRQKVKAAQEVRNKEARDAATLHPLGVVG